MGGVGGERDVSGDGFWEGEGEVDGRFRGVVE